MPPDADQPPGESPRRSRRAARAAEADDSSWADLMGVQRGATPESGDQRDDAPGAQRPDTGFWSADAATPPSGVLAGPPAAPMDEAFAGWLSDPGNTQAVRTEAGRTEAVRTEAGGRTPGIAGAGPAEAGYQPSFEAPAADPGRRPLPRRERARSSSSDDLLGGARSQPPGSPAAVDPTRPWWAPGTGGPNPGASGGVPAGGAGATVLPGDVNRGDLFALPPGDGDQPTNDSWYSEGRYGSAARAPQPAFPAPPPQVPVAPIPLDAAPYVPRLATAAESPAAGSAGSTGGQFDDASESTGQGLPRRKPSNLSELTPPAGLIRPGDAGRSPEPSGHQSDSGRRSAYGASAFGSAPGSAPSPPPQLPPVSPSPLERHSPDLTPPAWPPLLSSPLPPVRPELPELPDLPVSPLPPAASPQLPSPQLPSPSAPASPLPRRQPALSQPEVLETTGGHGVISETTSAGLPQRLRRQPADPAEGVGGAQGPPSNPLRELHDPPPATFAEVLNPGSTGAMRRPLGGYTPPRRGSQGAGHNRNAPAPALTPYSEPSMGDASHRTGSSGSGAGSSAASSAASTTAGAAASIAAAAGAAATGASAAATAASAHAAAHTAAGAAAGTAAASAASGAGAGAAAVLGSVSKAARRSGSSAGAGSNYGPADDETGTTMLPVTRRRRDSLERRSGRGKKDRSEKPPVMDEMTRSLARVRSDERREQPEHSYEESYGSSPAPWDEPMPSAGEDHDAAAAPEDHGRAGRNLPAAIGVGLLLAGLALASLFTRPEAFVALVCLVVILAVWELAGAMAAKQIIVPVIPLAVGAVGMLVSAYVAGEEGLLISFALTGVGVLLWRILEGVPGASRDVTAGIFTAAYVPLLAGFAILLLADPDGPLRVVTFILVTVCSDIGGYVAGVLAGRHPMAPVISPKKSWEGFAGSVITCLVSGTLCVYFLLDGRWWVGLALGAASAISATVGDLSESLIKRDLGVKDMGSLLPGHGGIMDRLDSLLPTAPLAFLLLHYLVT